MSSTLTTSKPKKRVKFNNDTETINIPLKAVSDSSGSEGEEEEKNKAKDEDDHNEEYKISQQIHSFFKALFRDMQENENPLNIIMYKYTNGRFDSPNGYLYDKRKITSNGKTQKGWFCAVVVVPHDPWEEFGYKNEKSEVPYLEDCVQECCAITGMENVIITNYSRGLFVTFEGIETGTNNNNLNLFSHKKKVKFVRVVDNNKKDSYNPSHGHSKLADKQNYRPIVKCIKFAVDDTGLKKKLWRSVTKSHERKIVRHKKPKVFKN